LSAAAYSIYSHLTSTAGGHPFHPQLEDGPCCGDKGTNLTWVFKKSIIKIGMSSNNKIPHQTKLREDFNPFQKYINFFLLNHSFYSVDEFMSF
jgi:hypothetical protein